MNRSIAPALSLSVLLVAGCASDRVVGPAQGINKTAVTLQTQLAWIQTSIQALQVSEQGQINANAALQQHGLTVTQHRQIVEQVSEATAPSEAFKILQTEANAQVSFATNPVVATTSLTPVSLPADKLGSVAKSLGELAKAPGTKADAQYLGQLAETVAKDLGTAKSTSTPPK